jgi:glycosyltransferase involved in cell wall biosynthesis
MAAEANRPASGESRLGPAPVLARSHEHGGGPGVAQRPPTWRRPRTTSAGRLPRRAPASPVTGQGASPAARSVIQVTLWNSPYLGNFMSSELALAEAVRAQLGLGTHFVLAHGAEGQPWLAQLDAAGATWSILPKERGAWRAHLDRVAAEHHAAIVHSHFTYADLQAAGTATAAGVPCVWHVRTGFTGYPLRQRVKDLLKLRVVARRRVDRIVTVSQWLSDLAARRGAPRGRIETVPNAIVSERFADPPDRAAARERFGLDADAEVVLCLGWWPGIKGVDVFLDALQAIADRHPRLNALLVGEQEMGSFLAERMPERPAWLRTSGFVDDSAWLFAAADVFVSPSRAEGQSSAVGEALACGLPVVMSDIPGTALWGGAPAVQRFPSENAPALAAELERLLGEPRRERVAAGARNREWLQRNYSLDAWSERMCAIYRSLLRDASGGDAARHHVANRREVA